jgi:hypothetical protein
MRFAAFISYSHSGDARVAAAIQSELQPNGRSTL